MKTLAELEAIRERMKGKVAVRETSDNTTRIVVGSKQGLSESVTVTQTGCIGLCQYEPIVEVYQQGKEKVTYVKMDSEKAKTVVEEHIKGGKVVTAYTIGGYNPNI